MSILLPLAVVGGAVWYFFIRPSVAGAAGALTASGTVETTEVSVAPEVTGRVAAVDVQEGGTVRAGDELLRLDDTVLQIQRRKVAAAGQAAITAAKLQVIGAQMALDKLNEDAPLIKAQALLDLANARDVLDKASRLRSYNLPGHRATSETIDATQARLVLADQAVSDAQAVFNKVQNKDQSDPGRAAAFAALDEARKARDAVSQNLSWYKGAPTSIEQGVLDAKVGIANEQVAQAEIEVGKWQDGPDAATLAQARATLENAKAQLELAQAQAASDLQAIDDQIRKLHLTASNDGSILSLNVEPGEVVALGSTVLVLGRLDQLTITVYVPEDRMGEVTLQQSARVSVDTFPGQTFTASVTNISDQAEFTPRNVQTVEGRKNTVFAIKLSLNDTSGKLKPGMPADVTFVNK
jgi:multidrug resistance efflux pump